MNVPTHEAVTSTALAMDPHELAIIGATLAACTDDNIGYLIYPTTSAEEIDLAVTQHARTGSDAVKGTVGGESSPQAVSDLYADAARLAISCGGAVVGFCIPKSAGDSEGRIMGRIHGELARARESYDLALSHTVGNLRREPEHSDSASMEVALLAGQQLAGRDRILA